MNHFPLRVACSIPIRGGRCSPRVLRKPSTRLGADHCAGVRKNSTEPVAELGIFRRGGQWKYPFLGKYPERRECRSGLGRVLN